MFYYLSNRIVPADEAKISVRDISILRGFGIFDFFRTHNGRPFLIDDYLQRFKESAKLIGLPLEHTKNELKDIVLELLKANNLPDAGIRMVLTGGESENAYTPAYPNFAILVEKLNWPNPEWFSKGIKLITHHYQREFSQIKSINYLTALALRDRVQDEGAMDVLYYHNGELREVTRSNIFIVKDGTIITPSDHILFGITRKKVIEIGKMYYPLEERTVRLEELLQADECFLTGTTKKIMAVVNVDGRIIGDGMLGKVTKHLMQMFNEFEAGN
jgi:branched-chain amino acid aminotransferase